MGFTASDVVPFTQARANLSELADQAKAGAEKIITKNGESYVALIDADRLDYYHRLERERIHLLLIDDARKRLVYAVVSERVKQHSASIRIVPDGERCRMIWITDVLPNEIAPYIDGQMELGAAARQKTFSRKAA